MVSREIICVQQIPDFFLRKSSEMRKENVHLLEDIR